MMARPALLIFFLGALRTIVFWCLCLQWTAGWLWSKPQADLQNYFDLMVYREGQERNSNRGSKNFFYIEKVQLKITNLFHRQTIHFDAI
jgi:hypothetical protein